jgi:hypothetical protein
VITQAHLVSLTPYLLALAHVPVRLIPTSAQGLAAMAAAQRLFTPLGLWNLASANYLRRNLGVLRGIVQSMYQPGSTIQPPIPAAPGAVLVGILGDGEWGEIATQGPGLVDAALGHLGFDPSEIVLYGSTTGRYDVALVIRESNGGSVHAITQKNYWISGNSARYYLGPDDISLTHIVVTVEDRVVTTDDVIASPEFEFFKRASGGDQDFLDRARTVPSSSIVSVEAKLGALRLRVVGGSTSAARYAGVVTEGRYQWSHGSGRLGTGAFYSDGDRLIGYLDTEHELHTARAKTEGDGGIASAWLSLSLSAAGMITEGTEQLSLQGDVRLVPQIHLELLSSSKIFTWGMAFGSTLAVVPGGRVDIRHPSQSIGVYPIRVHVEASVGVALNQAQLSFGGAVEVSRVRARGKIWARAEAKCGGAVEILAELEQRRRASFLSSWIGAGLRYGPASVRVLRSTRSSDMRAQAGLEIQF